METKRTDISGEKALLPEERVVKELRERGWHLTTAESCTGGKLAGRVLNVAGASEVYDEGYITYANRSKEKLLGVRHETLTTWGAVSPQTAREMALGAAREAGAQAALSVTGIAGPGGGTAEKPVGLVYIGCALQGTATVREYHFQGDREENRSSAVEQALLLLLECLAESREETI